MIPFTNSSRDSVLLQNEQGKLNLLRVIAQSLQQIASTLQRMEAKQR